MTQTGEVYFESIAMFAFILLAGRYIEQRAAFVIFSKAAVQNSLCRWPHCGLIQN